MENDSVSKKSKKKQGKGIIVAFFCAIIVVLGLILYICYDKGVLFTSNSKSENNVSEKKDNDKVIDEKKAIETLFSITSTTEFNIKNYSNSLKILDFSNSENGFLNGISTLDLENNDLFYVENKWQIVESNAKNHKYTINKINSNEYNNQKNSIYESAGSVSNLFVKDGIIYFLEQISTLNGNSFDETTNLKSYNLKNKSEKTIKNLVRVSNNGSFINGMYLDKRENTIYYSTSDNKLYNISLDGTNEKVIINDCIRMTSIGGILVCTTSNSENYILYNSDFKKINSSNVWAYKNGYIYSNKNNIIYYDGKEEKNIFTDSKEYVIKYVDGTNNTMLIVDSDGYGEGSNYKKINLIDHTVNNVESSLETFIKTIEYR